MRNETYKHLEDPLRLGPLTIGQWAGLLATGFAAVVFGLYVSPLPTGPTISVSMFMGLLPPAIAYAADSTDVRVFAMLASVYRWARGAKHFLPGGGEVPVGYVVAKDSVVQRLPVRAPEDVALARRQLEGAWDA